MCNFDEFNCVAKSWEFILIYLSICRPLHMIGITTKICCSPKMMPLSIYNFHIKNHFSKCVKSPRQQSVGESPVAESMAQQESIENIAEKIREQKNKNTINEIEIPLAAHAIQNAGFSSTPNSHGPQRNSSSKGQFGNYFSSGLSFEQCKKEFSPKFQKTFSYLGGKCTAISFSQANEMTISFLKAFEKSKLKSPSDF